MTAPAIPMTTGSLEAILGKNSDLIRKGLNGGVLSVPWPGPIIKTLVAPGNQIAVPTAFRNGSTGHVGEDGLTFATDDETADIPAWGSASFVRRDIQRRDMTLQYFGLETRRRTIEMYNGLDLSGVPMIEKADGTVEWVFDHAIRPPQRYWGILTLSIDGAGDTFMGRGKYFPKMSVTERDDYVEADGEDPAGYNMTLGSAVDDEAGFTCREFMFGPGAKARAQAMGIEVRPVTP